MFARFYDLMFIVIRNASPLPAVAMVYGLLFHNGKSLNESTQRLLEVLFFTIAAILAYSFPEVLPWGDTFDSTIIVIGIALLYSGAISACAISSLLFVIRASIDGLQVIQLSPFLLICVASLILHFGKRISSGRFNLVFLSILVACIGSVTVLYGNRTSFQPCAISFFGLFFCYGISSLLSAVVMDMPVTYNRRIREYEISVEKFRHLFEYAPIALWEEDYSEVARSIWETQSEYRGSGVDDFTSVKAHFSKVRILAVNRRAVLTAEADSSQELMSRAADTLIPESAGSLKEEIRAIADRRTTCSNYSRMQTLKGNKLHIKIHWNVIPGYEDTYERVIVSVIDTTEVVQQAQQLSESLQHQDMLIREIHHRVRNSLSIAYSILGLQKQSIEDAIGKRIISDIQNRIQTLSLIHSRLYKNKNVLQIQIDYFLEELVSTLQHQEEGSIDQISLDVEVSTIAVDYALPLGLITCELLNGSILAAYYTGIGARKSAAVSRLKAELELAFEGTVLQFRYRLYAEDGELSCPVLPDDELRTMIVHSMLQQLKAEIIEWSDSGNSAFVFGFQFR